jgi:hypothetical protein
MRPLVLALAVGCGAPAAPPVAPVARGTPVIHNSVPAADRWVFRQLRVGKLPIASRTSFELVLHGDHATLAETDEREHRALAMAEADRGAQWTIVAQRTYRGTARVRPGAVDLALGSDGVQPLELHCTERSVPAAAPGALRVPSPNRPADYECGDRGVWDPPGTTAVPSLLCNAGGASDADDEDDDDRLAFARPPGLEHASVNDDCVVQGGGLRIVQ